MRQNFRKNESGIGLENNAHDKKQKESTKNDWKSKNILIDDLSDDENIPSKLKTPEQIDRNRFKFNTIFTDFGAESKQKVKIKNFKEIKQKSLNLFGSFIDELSEEESNLIQKEESKRQKNQEIPKSSPPQSKPTTDEEIKKIISESKKISTISKDTPIDLYIKADKKDLHSEKTKKFSDDSNKKGKLEHQTDVLNEAKIETPPKMSPVINEVNILPPINDSLENDIKETTRSDIKPHLLTKNKSKKDKKDTKFKRLHRKKLKKKCIEENKESDEENDNMIFDDINGGKFSEDAKNFIPQFQEPKFPESDEINSGNITDISNEEEINNSKKFEERGNLNNKNTKYNEKSLTNTPSIQQENKNQKFKNERQTKKLHEEIQKSRKTMLDELEEISEKDEEKSDKLEEIDHKIIEIGLNMFQIEETEMGKNPPKLKNEKKLGKNNVKDEINTQKESKKHKIINDKNNKIAGKSKNETLGHQEDPKTKAAKNTKTESNALQKFEKNKEKEQKGIVEQEINDHRSTEIGRNVFRASKNKKKKDINSDSSEKGGTNLIDEIYTTFEEFEDYEKNENSQKLKDKTDNSLIESKNKKTSILKENKEKKQELNENAEIPEKDKSENSEEKNTQENSNITENNINSAEKTNNQDHIQNLDIKITENSVDEWVNISISEPEEKTEDTFEEMRQNEMMKSENEILDENDLLDQEATNLAEMTDDTFAELRQIQILEEMKIQQTNSQYLTEDSFGQITKNESEISEISESDSQIFKKITRIEMPKKTVQEMNEIEMTDDTFAELKENQTGIPKSHFPPKNSLGDNTEVSENSCEDWRNISEQESDKNYEPDTNLAEMTDDTFAEINQIEIKESDENLEAFSQANLTENSFNDILTDNSLAVWPSNSNIQSEGNNYIEIEETNQIEMTDDTFAELRNLQSIEIQNETFEQNNPNLSLLSYNEEDVFTEEEMTNNSPIEFHYDKSCNKNGGKIFNNIQNLNKNTGTRNSLKKPIKGVSRNNFENISEEESDNDQEPTANNSLTEWQNNDSFNKPYIYKDENKKGGKILNKKQNLNNKTDTKNSSKKPKTWENMNDFENISEGDVDTDRELITGENIVELSQSSPSVNLKKNPNLKNVGNRLYGLKDITQQFHSNQSNKNKHRLNSQPSNQNINLKEIGQQLKNRDMLKSFQEMERNQEELDLIDSFENYDEKDQSDSKKEKNLKIQNPAKKLKLRNSEIDIYNQATVSDHLENLNKNYTKITNKQNLEKEKNFNKKFESIDDKKIRNSYDGKIKNSNHIEVENNKIHEIEETSSDCFTESRKSTLNITDKIIAIGKNNGAEISSTNFINPTNNKNPDIETSQENSDDLNMKSSIEESKTFLTEVKLDENMEGDVFDDYIEINLEEFGGFFDFFENESNVFYNLYQMRFEKYQKFYDFISNYTVLLLDHIEKHKPLNYSIYSGISGIFLIKRKNFGTFKNKTTFF